jgi:hypothetical protein
MKLRYVRAGEEDPVTGKVASKSEWRGRDDPRLWEMDERFVREPGDFALGQTYAIKVEDGEPKLGDVVKVVDGKLKIVKQAASVPSIVIASKDNDDEEDSDEDEPKKQMLPRIFKEAFGVGLPRSVIKACVAVLPDDYKTYIELFAGASCGLLRWKDRRPDETEILIDIDPFVIAFLEIGESFAGFAGTQTRSDGLKFAKL